MGGFFVDLLATQYNQVCHGINTPLGLRPLPPEGGRKSAVLTVFPPLLGEVAQSARGVFIPFSKPIKVAAL